jgi:hypothetical protein
MIIVCDGERMRTHSVSLHQCEYFATLLENADLGSYGPDNIRTIALPDTFDHDSMEVKEFIMVLYDTLDPADRTLLRHHIRQDNVIALTQLAHYFGAPVLQAECDEMLTMMNLTWFPDKLLWLTQVAIKNHLPRLKVGCAFNLATNFSVNGTGLLADFDHGRGALCRDPVFVTEFVTILHQKFVELNQNYNQLAFKNHNLHTQGAATIRYALNYEDCFKIKHYNDAFKIVADTISQYY